MLLHLSNPRGTSKQSTFHIFPDNCVVPMIGLNLQLLESKIIKNEN